MSARGIVRERLSAWTGFDLERGGRADAIDRLIDERIAALGLASAEAYVQLLSRHTDPEASRLVNAITVGHTWFFRDREQTSAMCEVLAASFGSQGKRVKIWVAGCSTGDDAYTVAMLADCVGVDAEVLGTDINSEALDHARTGQYSHWSVREVPPEMSAALRKVDDRVAVVDRLRQRVRFERHNVLSAPPRTLDGSAWDMVLCRNVLIYFRREQADRALSHFAQGLAMDGWLFLGASDVLARAPPGFVVARAGSRYALQRRDDARGSAAVPAHARFAVASPCAAAEPSVASLIEQALARVDAGAPADALPFCVRALEQDPLSSAAHLVSGIAYHAAEDPEAAARSLRSALVLDPGEWLATFYLALTLDRLGREREAEREYEQIEAALGAALTCRSRLPALDAYRGEVAVLARARARRRSG